jgi:hypothetical protein
MSPVTLQYLDELNEQITIDTDALYRKALIQAYNTAHDKAHIVLKLIVSQPINLKQSDLKLDNFKTVQFQAPGKISKLLNRF